MSRSKSILHTLTSSWLVLGILILTQLAQIPIALAHLNQERFGLFAVMSQLLNSLLLAELGVSPAFCRLLIDGRAQGPESYRRMWASGLALLCIQSGIILLAVLVTTPFVPRIFSVPPALAHEAQGVFLTLGVMNAISYVLNIYALALFAGQRQASSNVVQMATTLVQFGGFILALKQGWGLWAYPASMAVAAALGAAWQFGICRAAGLDGGWRVGSASWAEMKGIFRLGLDVFVSTFFTVFINNSLLIFAGMVSTLEASARLAVNLKISQLGTQVLHRIPAAAEPILMELISHRDLGRFRFAWTALAKVTMALALAAAGCIFLWGSRLVAWWTDPGMNVEPAALAWLALLPLRFILHYFLVGTLVMFKEIRRVRTALIFEAALYTLLAWQLGRVAGVAGLLCGCVISLAGGAVWWGVPAVASLAGLRVREVVVLTVRACALPAAAYAVLAIFAPAGPQMAWPRLVGLTGGWLAFNAAHLFAVVLDAGDRAFLGAFRSRMATRLGFSRSA